MRRSSVILILSVVLAGFFLMTACQEKCQEIKAVHENRVDSNEKINIVFYADTREGVFENWGQKVHIKFIDKVLENEKTNGIKYLLFGGDNVLFGFNKNMWLHGTNVTKLRLYG